MKNLTDGRVEVVAEGEGKELKRFIDGIKGGVLGRYIEEVAMDREEVTGEFSGFNIRF